MTDKETNSESDTGAAVYFLQHWPSFPVLSASHTDAATGKTGIFETKSFPYPVQWNDVATWIDARQGKANLYFSVNPLIVAMDKKAERTDIASVVALQVDSDVRPQEDQAEGIARIVKMFEAYKVPPSLIIASGGGAQAFWMLETPIEIGGDLAKAEGAKLYNVQLERDLHGDNCHNIDRIMRLPGTINIPNAVKLRRGRKRSVASIYSYSAIKYPVSAFSKAVKVQEAEATPGEGPTAGIKIAISGNFERMAPNDERLKPMGSKWATFGFTGDTENVYGGDRSKALFAWTTQAIRAGIPNDIIASCIMDTDWKIGECVREKKNQDRELTRVIERSHLCAIDPDLADMNAKYAVVNINGKTKVMTQTQSAIYSDRWLPCYSTFEDFANLHSNRSKEIAGKDGEPPSIMRLGKWWLDSRQRRQYNDGLRYMPQHDADVVGEALNLWRGFTVSPRKGDCSLYLAHIRENICSGNEAHFQYLLYWMANTVQKRGQPGYVAVCLRGGKGTGKSFFARHFGMLYGQHFMQATNPEHLTGKFNQHLETVSLLFADECFYAGDRKHEQILKVLITEPHLIIEPKGINAYEAPNFLHIIMASNSDWIVPASNDERRYFVLDVGAGSQQNDAYFIAAEDQLKAGGYAALLDLLLGIDLTDWSVRKVPKTEGLVKQQALSRQRMNAVVEGWLHEGLPYPHERFPDVSVTTEDKFGKGTWHWIHSHHIDMRHVNRNVMAAELKKEWGFTSFKLGNVRGIKAPPLGKLRAMFDVKFGPQDWPDDGNEWGALDAPANLEAGLGNVAPLKSDDPKEIPF